MTRQQIKENRLKFVNGLLEPHRLKFTDFLENPDNPNERCCLGHGCDIFKIPRTIDEMGTILYGEVFATAPIELQKLLGLYNGIGRTKYWDYLHKDLSSLVSINDDTDLTTQQIGQLILDNGWIEGGENTPFKPLTDYPEEL